MDRLLDLQLQERRLMQQKLQGGWRRQLKLLPLQRCLQLRVLEEIQKLNAKYPEDKSWYKLFAEASSFRADKSWAGNQWCEWSWTMEPYLNSIDVEFTSELKTIRANPSTPIDPGVQDDGEKKRGALLHSLPGSLVRQRPLMVVKSVNGSNGYEAYRLLIQSNEPLNKNCSMSLLSVIMNWPISGGKGSLLSQVMQLQTAYNEYEKLDAALSDELKTAVVSRSVSSQLTE